MSNVNTLNAESLPSAVLAAIAAHVTITTSAPLHPLQAAPLRFSGIISLEAVGRMLNRSPQDPAVVRAAVSACARALATVRGDPSPRDAALEPMSVLILDSEVSVETSRGQQYIFEIRLGRSGNSNGRIVEVLEPVTDGMLDPRQETAGPRQTASADASNAASPHIGNHADFPADHAPAADRRGSDGDRQRLPDAPTAAGHPSGGSVDRSQEVDVRGFRVMDYYALQVDTFDEDHEALIELLSRYQSVVVHPTETHLIPPGG